MWRDKIAIFPTNISPLHSTASPTPPPPHAPAPTPPSAPSPPPQPQNQAAKAPLEFEIRNNAYIRHLGGGSNSNKHPSLPV